MSGWDKLPKNVRIQQMSLAGVTEYILQHQLWIKEQRKLRRVFNWIKV